MSLADAPYRQFQQDKAQDRLVAYPLHSRSVVFDIGGYKGGWTASLLERCDIVCPTCELRVDPIVHIFEPVKAFYNECVLRFKDYPRVYVHNYGLTNWTRTSDIVVDEAASCLHGPCPWRSDEPKPTENVLLRDIDEVVNELGVDKIELMSMNIEGEEYALLHRILTTSLIGRTKTIQVQFHDFLPDAKLRREKVRTMLANTHCENFCYPFVWESWTQK
jgi:FkbM family methyltransferase